MKKSKIILTTAIATLAVGTVACLALRAKRKGSCPFCIEDELDEFDTSLECDTADFDAVSETASYPNLSEEDMARLNELSEEQFVKVDALENTEERAIQHTIHFTQSEALEHFKNEVINEGYVVTSGMEDNELLVLNISLMDSDLILSRIFHLANLAKTNGGEYVKWIVK